MWKMSRISKISRIFGLLPMILEKSVQAQFLIPMAVSLGFGILFATFIILLGVPIAMRMLEGIKGVFERLNSEETSEGEVQIAPAN